MTRKCPFNGCEQRVPAERFGCKQHWFSLPVELRREIYRAYDDYLAGRIGPDELRRRQQAVLDQTQIGGVA